MSEFRKQLRASGLATRHSLRRAFVLTTEEMARSVRYGSDLTGAPGQPVKSGNLLGSWIDDFHADGEEIEATLEKLRDSNDVHFDKPFWTIKTTGKAIDKVTGQEVEVGYAKHVEENVRGVTFNSGGPHSVALTVAGMPRIIEHAVALAVSEIRNS